MDGEGETDADGKKKSNKKVKKTNKSKSSHRKSNTKNKFNTPQLGNDLSAKVYATMEKHKEVFFVIRLHSAQSAASLQVSNHHLTFLVEENYGVKVDFANRN